MSAGNDRGFVTVAVSGLEESSMCFENIAFCRCGFKWGRDLIASNCRTILFADPTCIKVKLALSLTISPFF